MPWRERTAMEEKMCFIAKCLEPGANVAHLCRQYGVARSTGHKWLHRYYRYGLLGLLEQSRRPKTNPSSVSAEIICKIVNYRLSYPNRGAEKLRKMLAVEHEIEQVPSVTSINRILARCGMVPRRRKRTSTMEYKGELTQATDCNVVWTADYKGWWKTKDGKRCEPLTIRDDYSRYVLDIAALAGTHFETAKERFRLCFELYGLPEAIRTDNGTPFSASNPLGMSRLSAWWIKLGIRPERIPKGKPYYNGAHERLHRDMAVELERNPSRDLASQQIVFDQWREDFNTKRPHSALKLRYPAEVYAASTRPYDSSEPEYEYPRDYVVRKIDSAGKLYFKNFRIPFSKSLVGEKVGIESAGEEAYVWFCDYQLATLDLKAKILTTPRGVVKQLNLRDYGI